MINRGVGRQTLFHKDEDYAPLERVMAEAFSVPVKRQLPEERARPVESGPVYLFAIDNDVGPLMERPQDAALLTRDNLTGLLQGCP